MVELSAEMPHPAAAARRLPGWVRPTLATLAVAGMVGLVVLLPSLIGDHATEQSLPDRLQPPVGFGGTFAHPLGTDSLGRDLLARIAVGAQSSFIVSSLGAIGSSILGTALGVVAGVFGSVVDRLITMVVETLMAIPFITIGMLVTATIGQNRPTLILMLIFAGWISHARIVRMQTRQVLSSTWVLAARLTGATRLHIAWYHVVPNVAPIALVLLFQHMGGMLLWSASLTWLGIGESIQTISLGGLVGNGQTLLYSAWWVSVFSGLAVAAYVVSCNVFADWVRHRLDPLHRKGTV